MLVANVAEAQVRYNSAQRMRDVDARFENTDGWIGADGGHSCLLDKDTRLWLFSDTWVGKIRDEKRVDATIVNNTLAIESTRGKQPPKFYVRRDEQGKPMAMFTPADGRGWFWLQDAVMVEEKLYLVLSQIERDGDGGAFGFRQIGQVLGVVDNPHDDPYQWQLRQLPMPCSIATDKRELWFGASLRIEGKTLYVYGTDEEKSGDYRTRFLTLAKVPVESIESFDQWQFYDGKRWVADFRKSAHLLPRMATEYSVVHLDELDIYAVVFNDNGLSDRIRVSTSKELTGPWTPAVTVFRCPEDRWDSRNFCYGSKAHPSLAGDNELVISYFVNATELGHVANDIRLYQPRFLRIKVDKPGN
ncbi:hypothetical protein Pan181_53810 [Aeoliella mucimassa]|uniref:DUF4185 domain-containing protein n=2 Tax=Aeoliella mucimassa TaxID=2527972 RepID=A0A518AWS6_9BACT|nr:hypothetical protein Pan181_53810 [Aeoliella mucimassa]